MYYSKALKSFGLWKDIEEKNKGFSFKGIFWKECFYICAQICFANILSQLETSQHCKYSYNILIDMALWSQGKRTKWRVWKLEF